MFSDAKANNRVSNNPQKCETKAEKIKPKGPKRYGKLTLVYGTFVNFHMSQPRKR